MSQDMSGPLSETPDGTTIQAHVATDFLPAGQRPNKTPIFISGASDTRAFLFCLRAFSPVGLVAQLRAKSLMVFPSTADEFRAAVTTLLSFDGKEGVSFHTFNFPDDRCARLLVKNHGRSMPENVVQDKLDSMNFRLQVVTQLRSCSCDQDPAKDRPSPLHHISDARARDVQGANTHRNLRFASVGGVVRVSERPAAM